MAETTDGMAEWAVTDMLRSIIYVTLTLIALHVGILIGHGMGYEMGHKIGYLESTLHHAGKCFSHNGICELPGSHE